MAGQTTDITSQAYPNLLQCVIQLYCDWSGSYKFSLLAQILFVHTTSSADTHIEKGSFSSLADRFLFPTTKVNFNEVEVNEENL